MIGSSSLSTGYSSYFHTVQTGELGNIQTGEPGNIQTGEQGIIQTGELGNIEPGEQRKGFFSKTFVEVFWKK